MTQEGKKYDEGKNRMGLVLQGFANALWEVGRVGTFGCSKYGEGNWQSLDNGIDRYKDALFRHLFQYMQGDEIDDESGMMHLSHMAWNALCLLELEIKEQIEKAMQEGFKRGKENILKKKFKNATEGNESIFGRRR